MAGEEWFYVDPVNEVVADAPITSVQMKEMFHAGKFTGDFLVWNDTVGDDYVQLSEVGHLMAFLTLSDALLDDTSNAATGRDDPGNWRELSTEDGRFYYNNLVTREVTWEKPDCLKTEEELGRVGDWQWIPHAEEGFIKAKKIEEKRSGARVFQLEDGSQQVVGKKEETFEVLWAYLSRSTADLVMLDRLEPPLILHNLKKRFAANEIYTKIGNILLSINPYKGLPLYLPSVLGQYASPEGLRLPPHVYEIAHNSFKTLVETGNSQSIIISGESGAGKTEATKQCLQFLAEAAGSEHGVEQKLLSTNPILESFGNAKTVRNDNSSRFGKYIEIFFGIHGNIMAATNTNYLLEKVRVVQSVEVERNYHIFYQLVKAASAEMRESTLGGDMSENHNDFFYLRGVGDVPTIDDFGEWNEVLRAFDELDIGEELQNKIFRIVATVLYLGNIQIVSTEKKTGITDTACAVSADEHSQKALRMAAKLMRVEEEKLSNSLTKKSFIVGSKIAEYSNLSALEAETNRDSLSKVMYNRLFDWIVKKLNVSLIGDTSTKGCRQIGILDIFGFEIFEDNSFEQLCINYTNEKLQQHFDNHTFKVEEALYTSEGLEFESVGYIDNQPVLDLIEDRKGILAILDQQMSIPRADDESVFRIMCNDLSRRKPFKRYAKKHGCFTVHHYAGEVIYDSVGFFEKNKDALQKDLFNLLSDAQFDFIHELFPDASGSSTRTLKKSLGAQFKKQLFDLMRTLKTTEPHYIRCVKPNAAKCPDLFEGRLVLEQLTYSGVFQAIKIRKSGFPFRFSHVEFFNRYSVILPKKKYRQRTQIKKLQALIRDLKIEGLQMGSSMILYRAEQHNDLELKRNLAINDTVELLQSTWRRWADVELFVKMKRVKPILEAAIGKREVEALEDALVEAADVEYDMKLIRDANLLRLRILHEIELTNEMRSLLDKDDIENTYADLLEKLKEAEELELVNEETAEATTRCEKHAARLKALGILEEALAKENEEELQLAIDGAKEVGIEEEHEVVVQCRALMCRFQLERDIVSELESACVEGGYTEKDDVIDSDTLATALLRAEEFDEWVKLQQQALDWCKLANSLLTVRRKMALALACELDSDEEKDAWESLQSAIGEILEESTDLREHEEMEAATECIEAFERRQKIKEVLAALKTATECMDYKLIFFHVRELMALDNSILDMNEDVSSAEQLATDIRELRKLLHTGIEEESVEQLEAAIEKAEGMGYENPLVESAKDLLILLEEAERKRIEEEARRKAEEERRRKEEEERLRIEEELRRQEEERLRQEEEARRIAEEFARRKAEEEEARRKAEEEARIRAELEAARLKAEEEAARKRADDAEAERLRLAKVRAEEEAAARRKAEDEAQRLKEEAQAEAVRLKEEEKAARIKAEEEKVRRRNEKEAAARLKAEEDTRRKKEEEEEAVRFEQEQEEAARLRVDEIARLQDAARATLPPVHGSGGGPPPPPPGEGPPVFVAAASGGPPPALPPKRPPPLIKDHGFAKKLVEDALATGAYLKTGDMCHWEDLEGAVNKAEALGLKEEDAFKDLLLEATVILALRRAIDAALVSKSSDDMQQVKFMIISATKKAPLLSEHREIAAAKLFFKEAMTGGKLAAALKNLVSAVFLKDHQKLRANLTVALKLKPDIGKTKPIISQAKELLEKLEAVIKLLVTGVDTRKLTMVKLGLERAKAIGFSKPIVEKATTFFKEMSAFEERIDEALEMVDVTDMKKLLKVAKAWRIRNEKTEEMSRLAFHTPAEKLLRLQLESAKKCKDGRRICQVSYKLKSVVFDKNPDKFEFRKFPRLLTPKVWAKTYGWPFGRDKLRTTFYVWSKSPIHHSLTDLNSGGSKVAVLKKHALEVNKSIMGYMGEMHWTQPLMLVKDLLKKCMQHVILRDETYCQLVKQLTENPNRTSVARGWALMTVMLDTFAPSKAFENYLECWLRSHPPATHPPTFMTILLHQTVFQGSRTTVPALTEIDSLLKGKVRALPGAVLPSKKKKKTTTMPKPVAEEKSTSEDSHSHSDSGIGIGDAKKKKKKGLPKFKMPLVPEPSESKAADDHFAGFMKPSLAPSLAPSTTEFDNEDTFELTSPPLPESPLPDADASEEPVTVPLKGGGPPPPPPVPGFEDSKKEDTIEAKSAEESEDVLAPMVKRKKRSKKKRPRKRQKHDTAFMAPAIRPPDVGSVHRKSLVAQRGALLKLRDRTMKGSTPAVPPPPPPSSGHQYTASATAAMYGSGHVATGSIPSVAGFNPYNPYMQQSGRGGYYGGGGYGGVGYGSGYGGGGGYGRGGGYYQAAAMYTSPAPKSAYAAYGSSYKGRTQTEEKIELPELMVPGSEDAKRKKKKKKKRKKGGR